MALPRPPRLTRQVLVVSFLLVALTVFALGGILGNDFIILDDREYVTRNAMVKAGLTVRGIAAAFTQSIRTGNWHPLTWISHMLDVELFGLRPAGHHAVNLAFHAANALVLFALLRALTGALWRSALVAALFAVHPLHVESVAWASERKDVLSTVLALCAALAYVRAARRGAVARSLAVPLLFALALMAKGMVVTLPFLFLLLDWWPLGRWSPLPRLAPLGAGAAAPSRVPPWREKVPLFLLSAAVAAATYLLQRTAGSLAQDLPLWLRAANAVVSYARYLGMAVWPKDLMPFYAFSQQGLPPAVVVAAIVLLALISAWAVRSAARRPHVAAGWFWYLGTLVPVIGFVQAGGQALADRYTYLPLTGVFLAVAWEIGELVARRRRLLGPAVALASAAVLALAAGARSQAAFWRDSSVLFSRVLRSDPENWVALNALGVHLGEQGRTEEAVGLFSRAAAGNSSFFDAHHNLGNALKTLGRPAEAEGFLREALRLRPIDPNANRNLGLTLIRLGREEEALGFLQRAATLDPFDAESWANLGAVRLRLGRAAEAREALEESLRLNPRNAAARYNLGALLFNEGRTAEALANLRASVEIEPGNSEFHRALGEALFEGGRTAEAIAELQQAVQLAPENAAAQHNLGVALATAGRLDEAVTALRAALAYNPGSFDSHVNLGLALTERGDLEGAAREFLEASALSPGDARVSSALQMLFRKPGGREAYARAAALPRPPAPAVTGR